MMKVRLSMIAFKNYSHLGACMHTANHPDGGMRVVHQGIINVILSNHHPQAFTSYCSYLQYNLLLFLELSCVLSHSYRYTPKSISITVTVCPPVCVCNLGHSYRYTLESISITPEYIDNYGCSSSTFRSLPPTSTCLFLFTDAVSFPGSARPQKSYHTLEPNLLLPCAPSPLA